MSYLSLKRNKRNKTEAFSIIPNISPLHHTAPTNSFPQKNVRNFMAHVTIQKGIFNHCILRMLIVTPDLDKVRNRLSKLPCLASTFPSLQCVQPMWQKSSQRKLSSIFWIKSQQKVVGFNHRPIRKSSATTRKFVRFDETSLLFGQNSFALPSILAKNTSSVSSCAKGLKPLQQVDQVDQV